MKCTWLPNFLQSNTKKYEKNLNCVLLKPFKLCRTVYCKKKKEYNIQTELYVNIKLAIDFNYKTASMAIDEWFDASAMREKVK